MTLEMAKEKLAKYGQEHVLKYYDTLTEDQKSALLAQIEDTDLSVLEIYAHRNEEAVKGKIEPLPAMELPEIEKNKVDFYACGLDAIKAGKVGAIMLAGGMGTRLGSDNPKGMYNIGLTHEVYIFQRQIENLLDVCRMAGTWVHLFIMTSDKNDVATRAFLHDNDYFGYNPDFVDFFIQEMAPAVDRDGKIYLETPYKMSTSPNGNGGWFSSMAKAGLAKKAKELGIEWLNTFAVDNVLQRIADPVFVGATVRSGKTVGAKLVKKNAPDEKVGVICLENSHPSIVEYYELTDELMNAKNENGDPAYYFGVILNYLFRLDELMAIADKRMPLHIVEKKIPYMNENGETVKPESPNGYKFETLVLDMINLADSCLPFEVVRNREFAPIKNKTGIDSVESARALCLENGIDL